MAKYTLYLTENYNITTGEIAKKETDAYMKMPVNYQLIRKFFTTMPEVKKQTLADAKGYFFHRSD